MFDNQKFYKNVAYLAKYRDIKMSSLEDMLDVSHGYLAKLGRGDAKTTTPSIKYITKIADELNVSIDALILGNLDSMNPNEQYIYDFIHKLVKMTEKGKIDWVQEKVEYDSSVCAYCGAKIFSQNNPFYSKFKDRYVVAENTLFMAELPNNEDANVVFAKILYSSDYEPSMEYDFDIIANEIYIAGNRKYDAICSSEFVIDEIKKEIKVLNSLLFDAKSRIGIEKDARCVINKFLFETDEDGNVINPNDTIIQTDKKDKYKGLGKSFEKVFGDGGKND